MTEAWVDWMLGILSAWGLPGIVVIMALETAGFPVPSELILPFGGFLVARGQATLAGATLAGAVGGVFGSAAAYGIGRWGGRPLLERFGPYIGVRRPELDHTEEWFRRRGEWAVFLARMMPGLRTLISLPAGAARMPLGRFLWFTFLGSLPWCFALTYAGYLLGGNWDQVQPHLHWLERLALAGVALVAAVWAWRWWRSRRA